MKRSHHGHIIAFADPDLSTAFDEAQLLLHGSQCPDHVHVRVCSSETDCHIAHGKLRSKVQKEMHEHYITTLKEVHGPVANETDDEPTLRVAMHIGESPACRVLGFLLVEHIKPIPILPTRVRRFATPPEGSSTTNNPGSSNLCQVKPWTITKHDINLETLFRPETLNLSRCAGECTTEVESYSNHAYIRHLYNRVHGAESVAEPCCVPLKVQPIQIVIMNKNNNIELMELEDAVVLKCGCI